MKIKACLSSTIDIEEKHMKYFYRLTEGQCYEGQAYGIEVERQDTIAGKLTNIERDAVGIISKSEEKVKGILEILFNNKVSPIHLIDVISSYVDECVEEFKS